MSEERRKVVEHRLMRAHETLTAAKLLLDNNQCLSAVNRLYYACFYAVTALLETRGLASSKHSGVLSLFNKNFVKPGAITGDSGTFYKHLYHKRHEGDYTDFAEFTNERVSEMYATAANFIADISRLVEKEFQN
ncbi:HEPN domain-containing protein [candidate division KSB1 bacterium]|nr:HEPN domain-containing protein [candidate division KSB1 bacterium]